MGLRFIAFLTLALCYLKTQSFAQIQGDTLKGVEVNAVGQADDPRVRFLPARATRASIPQRFRSTNNKRWRHCWNRKHLFSSRALALTAWPRSASAVLLQRNQQFSGRAFL
jgi:hypothetical protein